MRFCIRTKEHDSNKDRAQEHEWIENGRKNGQEVRRKSESV